MIKPSNTIDDIAKKYVGIFYHSHFGHTLYTPRNICNDTDDIWVMRGPNQRSWYAPDRPHFWGKPHYVGRNGKIREKYRFYEGGGGAPIIPNRDLLDYHASLLTEAGVDFIILELTNGIADYENGPSFSSGTEALFMRWKERWDRGLPTPKISFWITVNDKNPAPLIELENRYYKNYPPHMFFEHPVERKKLVLCSPPDSISTSYEYPGGIINTGPFARYAARICHTEGTGRIWDFRLVYPDELPPPLPFYFRGRAEQVCAMPSWGNTSDGINPNLGSQGWNRGEYFRKFVKAAIDYGAQILTIYSWNEWTAGNQIKDAAAPGNQQKASFIDQWLFEYSSDMEPVTSGGVIPPDAEFARFNLLKEKIREFKSASVPSREIPKFPGRYRLIAKHSGLRLDVRSGNTHDGAEITQANPNDTLSQIWSIKKHPDFPFTLLLSSEVTRGEKCLTVRDGNHAVGAQVYQWTYDRTMAQAWTLIPHPYMNGFFVLRALHSGMVLGVRDGCKFDAGDPRALPFIPMINQYQYNGTEAEAWRFEPV